jgi:uncharacterized protein YigA (DUF484 family)
MGCRNLPRSAKSCRSSPKRWPGRIAVRPLVSVRLRGSANSANHIRSQALIALRNGGGTIGMIALGSEEAQRFYEYGHPLSRTLGEMVSAALARVTKSVL